MNLHRLEIDLEVQGPFLSHTEGSFCFGLDMASRNYHGHPVINGSHLRGHLRHALEYFSKKLDNINTDIPANQLSPRQINNWFGCPSQEDYEARHGRLTFDPFWLADMESSRIKRYRIGINDATGTVVSGNLQVMQAIGESGEKLKFSGGILFWGDIEEFEALKKWLDKALQYISSLGALKSAGFGKLLGHTIKTAEIKNQDNCSAQPFFDGSPTTLELDFRLDRPFCVAQPHQPDSNRFVSEDIIPGSVFKGALARQWSLAQNEELTSSAIFRRLTVRHAQAETLPTGRSLPLPLSLVEANGQLIDATQHDGCFLLRDASGISHAPAFSLDWKDRTWTMANKRLQEKSYPLQLKPPRLLTVRTAIENESAAADPGRLFSLECIDTGWEDDSTLWRTRWSIDEHEKEDAGLLNRLLEELQKHGLTNIGKTKAHAQLLNIRKIEDTPKLKEPKNGLFIVLLVSPARMLSASHQLPASGGDLHSVYQAYFSRVSEDSIKLRQFFARQNLYGGTFYWKKYCNSKSDYRPEWMTEAGSVFVLEAASGKVKQALDFLQFCLEFGLPDAKDSSEDNTFDNPLCATNGFGEITINHPIHRDMAYPDTDEGQLIPCVSGA